jgi:hypothetical protein
LTRTDGPISKRIRFEIFARDAFTCQYCGRKPPEIILEIDHIEPRCHGGTNETINLVSACFDCNRGKAGKPLGHFPARPDADIEFLRVQQEIGEVQRFLETRQMIDSVRAQMVQYIQDYWFETIQTGDSVPHQRVITQWLGRYEPPEIISAIDAFLVAVNREPHIFCQNNFSRCVRYVSAVLRNRREWREEN